MNRIVKYSALLLFLFFVITAGPGPFADSSAWHTEKKAGKVVIYSRIPPGARVKEFRAESEINAPLERVWQVIRDIASYPSWFGDCMAAEEVARVSVNQIYYYLLMKTAGPLKNREIYAEALYSMSQSGLKREILLLDAPGLPRKSYKTSKPVKSLSGQWVLTAAGNDNTMVQYFILIDPGEEIPMGLSNLYVLGQVEKIIIGLIQTAEGS
ncbi:MAG: hypothetical protein E4H36_13355 [Spirochaetales bacterium]|nr:MAG: hypothetical protein E4H36_13355 [Spirochaetales bacterium]